MSVAQNVEVNPTDRVIFGLPVDTSILFFGPRGTYDPRVEKGKLGLLQKVAFLRGFLEADEKIVLVTTGCSPYTLLERLTMKDWWLILLKRALFVFTNKRLFHIPATWRFDYRGSVSQILYQDCRRLEVQGSWLVAEYHNGRKEKFSRIPGEDRALIKCFNFVTSESDRRSEDPQRNHLCPGCGQILRDHAAICPVCGLTFKSKARVWQPAVLVPGGAYFYAHRPFLGLVDALVESWLLIAIWAKVGATQRGEADAVANLLLILAALVLEKLLTIYHANGLLAELIPTDLKALLTAQQIQNEALSTSARPELTRRPGETLSVR